MKAVLEFTLPDDEVAFRDAQEGSKAKHVLYELSQYLRTKIKYAPDTQIEVVTDAYEQVSNKLWELVSQENVEIY